MLHSMYLFNAQLVRKGEKYNQSKKENSWKLVAKKNTYYLRAMRVCLYPVVTDVQPETYQKPVVVNFQQNTPAICNKFPEALGCTSLMDHTVLICYNNI